MDAVLIPGGTGKIGRALVAAMLARGTTVPATGSSEASAARLVGDFPGAAEETRTPVAAADEPTRSPSA